MYLKRLTGLTTCAYCGLPFTEDLRFWMTLQFDHVVPISVRTALGVPPEYTTDPINFALACSRCNGLCNRYAAPEHAPRGTWTLEEFVQFRDAVFERRRVLIAEACEAERRTSESRPWEEPVQGVSLEDEAGMGRASPAPPELAAVIQTLDINDDEAGSSGSSKQVTIASPSATVAQTKLTAHARSIYDYLRREVLPLQRVVTYADISQATGVPVGEEGGYMGQRLGELFEACDARGLPPVTSIVVRGGEGGNELYDRTRRHGMPGPGYFRACASSANNARRRADPGLERWSIGPAPTAFDPDTERWRYRQMIEAHQDTVWSRSTWPPRL